MNISKMKSKRYNIDNEVKEMNDVIPTTIRIEEQTKNAIEDIARIEKRSFNKMVEFILQEYILKYMEEQEKNGH